MVKEIKKKEVKNVIFDKEEEIKVLDPRKSFGLNVALGRVKLKPEELLEEISERKLKDENLVRQLLFYSPSIEEHLIIKSIKDEKINKAEKFYQTVENLPKLIEDLTAINFNNLYSKRNYKKLFSNYIELFEYMIDSKDLVDLVGILLIVGNQLNNFQLNRAEAFELNSLESFMIDDIKELLIKKFDFSKLKIQSLILPTTGLLLEFKDIKNIYLKGVIDDLEYELIEELFDKLVNLQTKLKRFFNIDDDFKFINQIVKFIEFNLKTDQ
ncbi:FH11 [Hepatospora eriocheir]|uniref:FH11 n=1 Tax=Hepatospora eriocheir TaxID=1081669 RepID=A0A1X0Q7D5_9MICR|nr:FH11 [Hepatospora eriocheir]